MTAAQRLAAAAPPPVVAKTAVALRLQAGRVTYEAWLQIGHQLAQAERSMAWWIGDWAAFGRDAWGQEDEAQAGGSKYAAAIAATGLDYQTLRNYAWVADAIPVSRRRDKLSFGHHAEVAALAPAEQEHWLRLAEAEGLSQKALREQMQQHAVGGRTGPPSGQVRITFTVPETGREVWAAAASRHGQQLDEWIVETLNEAALEAAA